ncbi:MAG: pantetheine-phosphate adenylyltransferase [Candidatus Hydrothermarchaeaceae archaeon]
MKPFKKVAVGGSFDVLHKGHKTLLKKAFEEGEHVLIGLTSSEMIEKDISSFEKRKKSLESFLEGKGRYGIVELSNPMGDAASDSAIDAIVVSEETEHMALKINNARKKN